MKRINVIRFEADNKKNKEDRRFGMEKISWEYDSETPVTPVTPAVATPATPHTTKYLLTTQKDRRSSELDIRPPVAHTLDRR